MRHYSQGLREDHRGGEVDHLHEAAGLRVPEGSRDQETLAVVGAAMKEDVSYLDQKQYCFCSIFGPKAVLLKPYKLFPEITFLK